MTPSNKIAPVNSGFEDFKTFVTTEAQLHPIVAVALAIIFPVGIVVAVCAWEVRKSNIAAKTKEIEKANAAARAQLEKQVKENLLFGAKILGVLVLGAISISAYYSLSNETIKQATNIISDTIQNSNPTTQPPVKIELPPIIPEFVKPGIEKIVTDFKNPLESPLIPDSIFQSVSNFTSNITSNITTTMFPTTPNATTTLNITNNTPSEPSVPYFNMTDILDTGTYMLGSIVSRGQSLIDVGGSTLSLMGSGVSSIASASRSTVQGLTTIANTLKSITRPIFIPSEFIGSLLKFKIIKWPLAGLILWNHSVIQKQLNSYTFMNKINAKLNNIDRYIRKQTDLLLGELSKPRPQGETTSGS